MSINRAIILGNVGRDPEIRTLQSGDKVANFSVATSEVWKDKNTGERKEQTDWHNISCFNQHIIKVIEQYVRKGSKVSVEGKIKTREYQDRDGNKRWATEIVIGAFDGRLGLEGGKNDGGDRDDGGGAQTQSRASDGRSTSEVLDDDIPF